MQEIETNDLIDIRDGDHVLLGFKDAHIECHNVTGVLNNKIKIGDSLFWARDGSLYSNRMFPYIIRRVSDSRISATVEKYPAKEVL